MVLFPSDLSWIERLATTCTPRVAGTTISSQDATTEMAIGMRLGLHQLKPHERDELA